MGHFHLKHANIITAVIAIVVVVIIANVIFRQKFTCAEDREDNQHLLWKWILVPVIGIIIIYFLVDARRRHHRHHHHQSHDGEYGRPEYNLGSEYGPMDKLRHRAAKHKASMSSQGQAASFAQQQQNQFRANMETRSQSSRLILNKKRVELSTEKPNFKDQVLEIIKRLFHPSLLDFSVS